MKRPMRSAGELEPAHLMLVANWSLLRAVEAAHPFWLLQKVGMKTASMNEVLCQREPKVRAAVNVVLEEELGEVLEMFGNGIHEIPRDELGAKTAETLLALHADPRTRPLLIAPTHELRAEIHATMRQALAEAGLLREKPLRIDHLVDLGRMSMGTAIVRVVFRSFEGCGPVVGGSARALV